jgi:hypothetical protein
MNRATSLNILKENVVAFTAANKINSCDADDQSLVQHTHLEL